MKKISLFKNIKPFESLNVIILLFFIICENCFLYDFGKKNLNSKSEILSSAFASIVRFGDAGFTVGDSNDLKVSIENGN